MERFIVFSDLHLHAWNYGARVDNGGMNSRLTDQAQALFLMASYANKNEIKNLFFCGDFFHTPGQIKTSVLQIANDIFHILTNSYGLKIHYIVGNHDQANKKGTIHALSGFKAYGVVLCCVPYDIPGLPPIVGIDYTEDTEVLARGLDIVPDESLIFMHQGVSGIEINAKGFTLNEIMAPDMVPATATHVFAGHYHSFNRVSDKLTIPGAPMQHNWGDVGDRRGFLDVGLENGCIHIKHVSLDNQPVFLKKTYEECLDQTFVPDTCFLRISEIPNRELGRALRTETKVRFANVLALELELVSPKREEVNPGEFDSLTGLFESYVEQKKITGRELEVGKEIIEGKYQVSCIELGVPSEIEEEELDAPAKAASQ